MQALAGPSRTNQTGKLATDTDAESYRGWTHILSKDFFYRSDRECDALQGQPLAALILLNVQP